MSLEELRALGDLNVLRATWALFSSEELFAKENHAHNLRGQRRAELLMELPASGEMPDLSTQAGERLFSDESRKRLIQGLLRTFSLTCSAIVIALLIAGVLGAVHPSIPLHPGRVFQIIGGALALWGTLFALDGPIKSWGGGTVPERVHSFIFTCLLAFGGALALLGTLL